MNKQKNTKMPKQAIENFGGEKEMIKRNPKKLLSLKAGLPKHGTLRARAMDRYPMLRELSIEERTALL